MKILALEHELPGTTAAQFQQYANDEARKVWELHQAGIIRELYFRADKNEAVLILECASVIEAQEILATLPLVQAGLISFDVIPLKAYPEFKRHPTHKVNYPHHGYNRSSRTGKADTRN